MVTTQFNNHGQFKMQQMIFMIVAVFLFFVLAGLFVLSGQLRGIKERARALEENQAILMAQFLVSSPEFACSQGAYCIDTDKIINLMNRTAYKDFWPVAYIKVAKVYPQNKERCTLGNYPNCGIFDVFDSGFQSSAGVGSYVALCRKDIFNGRVIDKCELGQIIIGYKVR